MYIKRYLKQMTCLVVALFCLIWPLTSISEDAQFITASHKPVVVSSTIIINSFHEIDTSFDHYTVHAILMQSWNDPKEVFKSKDNKPRVYTIAFNVERKLASMWHPNTEILNTSARSDVLYNHLIIHPNGDVTLLKDISATINHSFALEDMPFIKSTLDFSFRSFTWDGRQLVYSKPTLKIISLQRLVHQGWRLSDIEIKTHLTPVVGMKYPFSTVSILFHTSRAVGFFLVRYILPNLIIVIISWISFLVRRDKIHLGIGCLVGIVAYQIFMTIQAPYVAYLTALDFFFIWSILNVMAVIARNAFDMRREHNKLPPSKTAILFYILIPLIYIVGVVAWLCISKFN